MNPVAASFQLAFQISPIILVNGIANGMPGGLLPIIALTEALNLLNTAITGLLGGTVSPSLDNFFAQFLPLPGSTLISQQIGTYPFANQAVAANAVIRQPLKVSMQMICPVRQALGYAAKMAILTNLKQQLDLHNNSGGVYTIATPAYIYTNCVMLDMRDTSAGQSRQMQHTYQLDFEQPLLTQQQAQQQQNSMLSQITNQVPSTGELSGLQQAQGSTTNIVGPSVVSPAQPLPGAAVSGPVGSIANAP